MNVLAELVAQLPDINWASVIAQNGPLGIMCAWLMLRTEKKADSLSSEIVAELQVLGHRINGMTRAMLADVASRETTGDAMRTLVHKEQQNLDAEDEVKEIRWRASKKK